MRADQLIELLKMFPASTEVYVQTCESDLLSPLQKRNLWLTESFVDERYKNLESAKLVITAFIKGDNVYQEKNKQSGVLVKYEPSPEQVSKEGV